MLSEHFTGIEENFPVPDFAEVILSLETLRKEDHP